MYIKVSYIIQEPVRVLLGERRQWKGRGSKRRCVIKRDEVMYIPLLDTLQSLLNNESILAEVFYAYKVCVY